MERTDPLLSPLVQAPRRGSMAGQQLGSYRIDRLLGSGGMGDVYLGHDARLDRQVAIKIFNPLGTDEPREAQQRRLHREALALAKLSHPNILTIFEIGEVDGVLFIATEYVDGSTLNGWLSAAPRPLPAILALFVQAGRGLAASHEAGLIHRDFKPDNVLVDRDGRRARVADFGLVADAGREVAESRVSGTPSYMAPEQHRGGRTDARSDQFAFCVTLFEAVYGVRPFQARSVDELRRLKEAATIAEPPQGTRVPARLRAAILRGLAPDPAARHPSMAELLAILEHDPAARRRRVLLVAGPVVAAAVAALVVARATAPEKACLGAERKLAGIWDDGVRAKVRAAFTATGRPAAGASFELASAALDHRATSWVAMHDEACTATAVRHEQSPAMLDLRVQCLDARRAELGAVTGVLSGPVDPAMIYKSVQTINALPSVAVCADRAALSAAVPLPSDPGLRLAAQVLRSRIAAARVQAQFGRLRGGLPLAHALVDEARALHAPAVLAQALLVLVMYQRDGGERPQVEATLRDALLAAAEARDDWQSMMIWRQVIYEVGANLGRWNDAQLLVPGARAALARAGNPPIWRAWLLEAEAIIVGNQGDATRARAMLEEGLAAVEGLPDNAQVRGGLLNDLGIWLRKENRLADAKRALEQALAIDAESYGDDNPGLATELSNLGNVATDMGDLAGAEGYLRRALALAENGYGPEHSQVARALNNLGGVLAQRGEYRAAVAAEERALAIQEKVLGPTQPELATTLNNLGYVHTTLGDLAEARRLQERALAIQEREGDTRAASSRWYLAEIARLQGDVATSRSLGEQALEAWVKSRGPDHPYVARGHAGLARTELAAGRADRAQVHAEQAVAIVTAKPGVGARNRADRIGLLGDVLQARGRYAEALARQDEALALLEQAFAADDPDLAAPLYGKGLALLQLGRTAEAAPFLERATKLKGPPALLAEAQAALARTRPSR